MKKNIFKFLILILLIFPINKIKALDVSYQSHVRNIGWQNYVSNGEQSGTTGRALCVEAIKIKLSEGDIYYRTHIRNIGWENKWHKNDEISGTTGKALAVEAIQIKLSDEISKNYNIYYRTHIRNIGWENKWHKNGEISGTTGRALSIEAIQIKLIKKGVFSLSYQVQNKNGWLNLVSNENDFAGTTGKALSISKLKVNFDNSTNYQGNIYYQTYTTNSGWGDYVSQSNVSGKDGENIEAIKLKLDGELANNFNIFYRVHVSNIGWLDWTNNDKITGSIGYFYGIEAIQIRLLPNTDTSLRIGENTYKYSPNKVNYSTHILNLGWQTYANDGEESGSTGKNLGIEALKIKLDTKLQGFVIYKVYENNVGWTSNSSNDSISGSIGKNMLIEGVKIKLNGTISNYYDIYYRTHVSNVGWLGWTSNNKISGVLNSNTKIEAIQIKLVKKGTKFNENTSNSYFTGRWQNNKYYDYFNNMATGFKYIDGIKYYFLNDGTLYKKNAKKYIDVSSWQGDIDWDKIKRNNSIDGAIIRLGWGTTDYDAPGLDNKFDRNINSVKRLGIPYAIYIYAYAETTRGATKEAEFVYNKMKQYGLPSNTYIWYDAEIPGISKGTMENSIRVFSNYLKNRGYKNVGVYSSVRQLDTNGGNLNSSYIRSFPIWVAQYYSKNQYSGNCMGWQFQSDGRIDGINTNVDVNIF